MTIYSMVESWSVEDRANVWHLLTSQKEHRSATAEDISNRFDDLYYGAVRDGAKVAVATVADAVKGKGFKAATRNQVRTSPAYERLIKEACRQLKINDESATLEEWELFLSQHVILLALQRMPPRERAVELAKEIDASELAEEARVGKASVAGPVSLLTVFTLAGSSGFGVYLAATTALGFLTSLLGITLPFVIYTGLTTALSMLLTPWTAVAGVFWLGYKLTGPKWTVIIPALLYIAAVRHKSEAQSA